jgi:hypothetical protein
MLAGVRVDTDRAAVGLSPFPKPGPPLGMPDAETTKEILKDDRVQASLKRGDGGTVRAGGGPLLSFKDPTETPLK